MCTRATNKANLPNNTKSKSHIIQCQTTNYLTTLFQKPSKQFCAKYAETEPLENIMEY